jgi:ribosomal protein L10
MSKVIKQMEMDALKGTFKDVRDLVLLSSTGLGCQVDNQLRLGLRKKNIHLQMVKNSLTRRVFGELGIKLTSPWVGTTVLAWGAGSISELTRELKEVVKKNDKQLKLKVAIAEGAEITIEQAEKRPTREEAIGRIIALALAPAGRLISQIKSPASRVAAQIKVVSEKPPEAPLTPAPAAPAPAAG